MRRNVPAALLLAAMLVMFLPGVASGDRPTCLGFEATIVGSPGPDLLVGTADRDVIMGFGGDDVLRGRRGEDVICGGPGNDVLWGGPGDDLLAGDEGADRLQGAGGSDTLLGGSGNDRILGGPDGDAAAGEAGDDVIRTHGGDDELSGGEGEDVLRGGDGSDLLAGWEQSDELNGGRGDDHLMGGPGSDMLEGRAGDDKLDGGPDDDTLFGAYGIDECDGESVAGCEITAVSPGDRGAAVGFLQQALRDKALFRGPFDGVFGAEMAAAVVAFHKINGDPAGATWSASDHVDDIWTLEDWDLLRSFTPTPPKVRPAYPDRVEVDIGHQVLYLVEGGEVAAIMPVSTGGDYWYLSGGGGQAYAHTPRGHHTFYRYVPGWWGSSGQYESWFFKSIFAVHGYRMVPPYPVSHGCVRVHLWNADWLTSRFHVGMSIFTWDE